MENLTIFNPIINIDPVITILNNIDVSESTRQEYKERIKYFLQFLNQKGEINNNSLLEFKHELEKRADISISTKNKYLAVARVYVNELRKKGVLKIEQVKQFKQSGKHKKYGHTEEEVKKILKRLESEDLRTKVIIYLAIFQGLRQIEIVRINVEDINLKEGTMLIQGKGRDDKELINLHPTVIKCLEIYMKGKKTGKLINLTTRSLQNIYKKVQAGLDINKSLHGLRHYFTTKLIEVFEGNIIEVAKYTRHQSFEMLQVYNDEVDSKKSLPVYVEAFNNLTI